MTFVRKREAKKEREKKEGFDVKHDETTVVVRRVSKIARKQVLDSSCPSVRLSVHIEQLGSHWTDFSAI